MTDRPTIKQGLRWKIFARDGFRCRYCGMQPPDAILHVDHAVAVANGGGSEEENLVTACQDCNIGKGARVIPAPVDRQPAPVDQIVKFASAVNEYPPAAGRLIDRMIAEVQEMERKGIAIDVASTVLTMAAFDMAAIAFRGCPIRQKRMFMKMAAAAFDDSKVKDEPQS